MTLVTRIARLFKADLHGLLDSLEEPHIVLKQAIREMQEEIDKDEARLESLIAAADRLSAARADLTEHLKVLETRIDLCFDQNHEALAKSLIRRKLESLDRCRMVDVKFRAMEAENAVLRTRLEARREELVAVVEKQRLFAEGEGTAAEDMAEWGRECTPRTPVSDDEIEVAFLQEKLRRTGQSSAQGPRETGGERP